MLKKFSTVKVFNIRHFILLLYVKYASLFSINGYKDLVCTEVIFSSLIKPLCLFKCRESDSTKQIDL